jgi:hypothetical protein
MALLGGVFGVASGEQFERAAAAGRLLIAAVTAGGHAGKFAPGKMVSAMASLLAAREPAPIGRSYRALFFGQ